MFYRCTIRGDVGTRWCVLVVLIPQVLLYRLYVYVVLKIFSRVLGRARWALTLPGARAVLGRRRPGP